jgi:hypothetical protein
MMKSFHARMDSVTRDLTRYEASNDKFAGPTMQYTAEWIARLQCRNDILDEKINIVEAMLVEARESVKEFDKTKERLELMEGKVHKLRQTQGKDGESLWFEIDRLKKMAKELGIQDVALAESKRKLDAANDLLKGKDGIIADLRDRQEEILGEDAEYFEELEACNKRQKRLLEESREKTAILYATLTQS